MRTLDELQSRRCELRRQHEKYTHEQQVLDQSTWYFGDWEYDTRHSELSDADYEMDAIMCRLIDIEDQMAENEFFIREVA